MRISDCISDVCSSYLNPDVIRGRTVLDFATGSGLAAIAAARAGATQVTASDIDPFAIAAAELNAEANGVTLDLTTDDLIGRDDGWAVVLAGDICYEKPLAERVTAWLKQLAGRDRKSTR